MGFYSCFYSKSRFDLEYSKRFLKFISFLWLLPSGGATVDTYSKNLSILVFYPIPV